MNRKEHLLKMLQEHVGEWVCLTCGTENAGQPAKYTNFLRNDGYVFEETGENRFSKQMYCEVCGKKTSHAKLLQVEQKNSYKPRLNMTPKEKARIRRILEDIDAFTEASISSNCEVDHKVPLTRLNEDIDSTKLNNDEIKEHFQLLTRDHNLLKDRACQHCLKYNERPPLFGITYWYVGDEHYNGTCEGCGWYDPSKWRDSLNQLIKKKTT